MAVESESLVKRPLYVFDLPRELLATFQPIITSATNEASTPPDADPQAATPGFQGDESVKATACALCKLSFANVQDQRSHVRSDLHRYNLKQRMRGLKPVSDAEFEELIGDLDESLSGSDSSSSESDSDDDTKLGSLLKKQANISDQVDDFVSTKKPKRGAGKPPMVWFTSPQLPVNTQLGVWRAIFTKEEQPNEHLLKDALQSKQLEPVAAKAPVQTPKNPPDGGVSLPVEAAPPTGPSVFLCMIGGGHFAAMIVSLAPKITKHQTSADASRNATVIAHKTFHRYTTRRKQGGAQSANDNSKGNAHSAGSSLRRYNEMALINDVRSLLVDWKPLIDQASLLFVRATGKTNRSTLFGASADDGARPLAPDDLRLRGFPFSTRRATEGELMRCFVELTRLKVRTVDPEAEARAAQAEADKTRARAADEEARRQRQKDAAAKQAAASAEEQEATLHTTQLTALIKRSKAPAVLSYLSSKGVSANYTFYPPDAPAHHHAPTPLHLAAHANAPAVVTALLTKADADPTALNPEGQPAFALASDRATRDAFRAARATLGEGAWAWDAAGVPGPLSRAEVDARAATERAERAADEAARREAGLRGLAEAEAARDAERAGRAEGAAEQRHGKGRSLASARGAVTAEQRRAEEARGMTPAVQARMEREKRARAAEERMRRLQQQQE